MNAQSIRKALALVVVFATIAIKVMDEYYIK